jgi:hypothetical protein
MTPEERLNKVEALIEKQNEGIQSLIVVARTCLDSIRELRDLQRDDHNKLIAAQSATDEKLNILIDTVDRIIRKQNGQS